jgi:hypothetical protein
MCRMDFDHPKAGLQGTSGGCLESADDLTDSGLVQSNRRRITFVEGNGTGTYYRPAALLRSEPCPAFPRFFAAGLASGMCQLNAGDRALRMNELGDARQRSDVLVVPNA